jgi:RNA polymerase sigma-70 factor, ECF subfamily
MSTTRQDFERLALEQLDLLYRVALRLCKNATEAEDLVQDTYARAIRSWQTFDPASGGIRQWMIRILRNTHISRYHQQTRQPLTVDDQTLDMAGPKDQLPPWAHSPIPEQLDQEMSRALEDLPEEFRSVIMLWALDDLSYQEIADALEIPIGTVMSRLHRARARLAEQLREHYTQQGFLRE